MQWFGTPLAAAFFLVTASSAHADKLRTGSGTGFSTTGQELACSKAIANASVPHCVAQLERLVDKKVGACQCAKTGGIHKCTATYSDRCRSHSQPEEFNPRKNNSWERKGEQYRTGTGFGNAHKSESQGYACQKATASAATSHCVDKFEYQVGKTLGACKCGKVDYGWECRRPYGDGCSKGIHSSSGHEMRTGTGFGIAASRAKACKSSVERAASSHCVVKLERLTSKRLDGCTCGKNQYNSWECKTVYRDWCQSTTTPNRTIGRTGLGYGDDEASRARACTMAKHKAGRPHCVGNEQVTHTQVFDCHCTAVRPKGDKRLWSCSAWYGQLCQTRAAPAVASRPAPAPLNLLVTTSVGRSSRKSRRAKRKARRRQRRTARRRRAKRRRYVPYTYRRPPPAPVIYTRRSSRPRKVDFDVGAYYSRAGLGGISLGLYSRRRKASIYATFGHSFFVGGGASSVEIGEEYQTGWALNLSYAKDRWPLGTRVLFPYFALSAGLQRQMRRTLDQLPDRELDLSAKFGVSVGAQGRIAIFGYTVGYNTAWKTVEGTFGVSF